MLSILGMLVNLVGLVCAIIIIIHAFQKEIWKGIVCILCGIYLIYYGFAEFEHPKKMPIVLGMLGCFILGAILNAMGMAAMVANLPKG